MKFGTQYEQKDIIIVPFPYTDFSTLKQRPALIISNSNYNKKSQDIIISGITSNLKNSNNSILIDNPDLIDGKIPKKSRIKADKIFTIEKGMIKKKIGKINDESFGELREEILNLI